MKKFLKSFTYAWNGICSVVKEQQNFRVHMLASVMVISLGFYYQVTPMEWCVLLVCIGSVLALELINSSLENLVDLVTVERKPLAGKIKDIAAGAVLVGSVFAVIIGVIIFEKYIVQ